MAQPQSHEAEARGLEFHSASQMLGPAQKLQKVQVGPETDNGETGQGVAELAYLLCRETQKARMLQEQVYELQDTEMIRKFKKFSHKQ